MPRIETPDGRYISMLTAEGAAEFFYSEAFGRVVPFDVFGDLYAHFWLWPRTTTDPSQAA